MQQGVDRIDGKIDVGHAFGITRNGIFHFVTKTFDLGAILFLKNLRVRFFAIFNAFGVGCVGKTVLRLSSKSTDCEKDKEKMFFHWTQISAKIRKLAHCLNDIFKSGIFAANFKEK